MVAIKSIVEYYRSPYFRRGMSVTCHSKRNGHDTRSSDLSVVFSHPFSLFVCSTPKISVNTSGIPRLTKFYTPLHQSSQTVVQKIFSLISLRPAGLCNFLDAPELEAFLGPKDDSDERWRVVYRNYATLYFVFVVDGAESELGILDLIQVSGDLISACRAKVPQRRNPRFLWRRWTGPLRTSVNWT